MTNSHTHNVTRSFGLLEEILAKKRALLAESKITPAQRKGRILDVGCGAFPYFLTNTIFQEKYGVDGSELIKNIKDSNITLKQVNVEEDNFPFPKNHFDVVTMLAVFEHINEEKIDKVLSEVLTVLKSSGTLILTTPSPWSAPVLYALSRIGLISKIEIDDHKHAQSPNHIISHLQKAGFRKQTIKYGYFELYCNMWFIATKT